MNHLIVNHADMFSALSLIGQAAAPLLPWHFFRTLACPSASWATHPASSRGPGSVEKMGLYTVQNGASKVGIYAVNIAAGYQELFGWNDHGILAGESLAKKPW